jgi:hypothetical protein
VPTIPWTTLDPAPPDAPTPTGTVVVMASRFRVRRYRHMLPFLLDSMRVRSQVARAPGAVGMSLVARPLRREFFTLSAWSDRAALDATVTAEPHRSVMRRQRDAMAESRFAFWEADRADLPVSWDEARRRLG